MVDDDHNIGNVENDNLFRRYFNSREDEDDDTSSSNAKFVLPREYLNPWSYDDIEPLEICNKFDGCIGVANTFTRTSPLLNGRDCSTFTSRTSAGLPSLLSSMYFSLAALLPWVAWSLAPAKAVEPINSARIELYRNNFTM